MRIPSYSRVRKETYLLVKLSNSWCSAECFADIFCLCVSIYGWKYWFQLEMLPTKITCGETFQNDCNKKYSLKEYFIGNSNAVLLLKSSSIKLFQSVVSSTLQNCILHWLVNFWVAQKRIAKVHVQLARVDNSLQLSS